MVYIVVFVTLNSYILKSTKVCTLLPLCCLLAISCLLHCSVFKVQISLIFFKIRLKHSFAKMLQSNFGGDNRDRTDDPLLARQVLSQLSYTPILRHIPSKLNNVTSTTRNSDLRTLQVTTWLLEVSLERR